MNKMFTVPTRDTAWENGITLEHVDLDPVHFNNRGELRRYCKKNEIVSGALL